MNEIIILIIFVIIIWCIYVFDIYINIIDIYPAIQWLMFEVTSFNIASR